MKATPRFAGSRARLPLQPAAAPGGASPASTSHPGQAHHQEVVAAGRGNLQSPACARLPPHVAEVARDPVPDFVDELPVALGHAVDGIRSPALRDLDVEGDLRVLPAREGSGRAGLRGLAAGEQPHGQQHGGYSGTVSHRGLPPVVGAMGPRPEGRGNFHLLPGILDGNHFPEA